MRSETSHWLLSTAACILAVVIFVIDAFTPVDFAIAVLYVVVILLVALTGSISATRLASVASLVLTLSAYWLSSNQFDGWVREMRVVIALLGIGTTTLLAMRNLSDIEALQHAKAALARSEAFLAEAQQLSQTGSVAIFLPAGTMVWSTQAYRIFGYPATEAPHIELILPRVHPDDLGAVQQTHAAMLDGTTSVDLHHRLSLPEGVVRHVHLVARRTASHGDRHEYVGALMDVTEAAHTQETLQRTMADLAHVARVTTLGKLAASIAHEVSQPLTAVITCGRSALNYLGRTPPKKAEATNAIEQILRDATRATDIIQRIRAMAKKSTPKYEQIDADTLVHTALEVVRRELLDAQVHAELDLNTGAARVSGDWTLLQQVLVNLIVNAVQAMTTVAGRRTLTISSQIDMDGTLRIAISDTGPGITSEAAQRLFNAFYTTKSQGMGLGLSICRDIVETHGGTIEADSATEGGARLTVRLPVLAPAQMPLPAA